MRELFVERPLQAAGRPATRDCGSGLPPEGAAGGGRGAGQAESRLGLRVASVRRAWWDCSGSPAGTVARAAPAMPRPRATL